MSQEEKAPLLKEKENLNGSKFGYDYFMLLIVMIFVYTSVGINFYTGSQWIQYKVRKEILQGDNINATSVCEGTNQSDPQYAKYKDVEQKTALWQMATSLATAGTGLIAITVLPSLSDIIGRKIILFVIPMTAMLLKCIMYALIIYYEWDLMWVVISSSVEGLFGAMYTFISGAHSYIADITKSGRHRTLAITIYEGSFLICYTLSGLVAGYFIEFEGYFIPAATCVVLQFIAWCIVIFLLPETHKKENRTQNVPFCLHFKRITEFYRSKVFAGKLPIPATFSFLVIPVTKSMMSSMTPADKQGSLFSGVVTVQMICTITASYLFNTIYSSTLSIFHGFVFLVSACFCGVVLLILIVFAKAQSVEEAVPKLERIETN